MERANKAADRKGTVNSEEKWIRLQEFGLSQILAIPVALMLSVMFQLNSIMLGIIILVLIASGYVCLKLGHDKRREIQDQKDEASNN